MVTEIHTTDFGKMILNRAKVLTIGLDCNRLMREIGRKIKEMVQEPIHGKTVINTSEDGKMIQ